MDESTASEDDDRKRPAVPAAKPPPSVASCVGENETRATATRELKKNVGHSITPSPQNRPAAVPPPAVVSNAAVPPPAVVLPPPPAVAPTACCEVIDLCSPVKKKQKKANVAIDQLKASRHDVVDLCSPEKKKKKKRRKVKTMMKTNKNKREIGMYYSDEDSDYIDYSDEEPEDLDSTLSD